MYKYNKAENKIVEMPSMEEPIDICVHTDEAVSQYRRHIISLKIFPCHPSCIDIWEDGKEVEHDKDFQFEQWCNNKSTLNGVDTFIIKVNDPVTFNKRCDYCYLLAIPTPPVVNEDESWYEVIRVIMENYANYNYPEQAVAELKKSFTITKK